MNSASINVFVVLLVLWGIGCNDSSRNASKVKNAVAQPAAWGGLTVHTVGTDVAHARHVIIMLHGFGAPGQDMVPMGRVMPVEPLTCFVFPEGPVELDGGRRAWWTRTGGFDEARQRMLDLLHYVKTTNPNASITLGGFSQGATMTSNFLGEDPSLLDAAILLSPSGRTRYEPKDFDDKPVVFLSHGRADRSFQGGQALQQRLTELNYEVEFFPYDGGHTIPQEVMLRVANFLVRVQSGN